MDGIILYQTRRNANLLDNIKVHDQDRTRLIQMNRPAKKNALTLAMYDALANAIESAGKEDSGLSAIVITGSEGAYCAGNDLQDFLSIAECGLSAAAPILRLIDQLAQSAVPIVAAVDGVAVGIGATMLLHCDIVYASPTARFQFPFVNLGLVPEAGSSLLLPRLAGYQKASELLLLGRPFSVEEAEQIGLIASIIPSAELVGHAMAVAQNLAEKPQSALRATRALLRRGPEPITARITAEVEQFDHHLRSPELREAVAAFQEGRKPNFSKPAS